MDFDMIETEVMDGTIIKVVGVGGAGGNAVQHMISRGVQGVEFICMNTDAQALKRSTASRVLQLGNTGLGAGAKPEVGRGCADQAREQIADACVARTWSSSLPAWAAAPARAPRRSSRRWPRRWAS